MIKKDFSPGVNQRHSTKPREISRAEFSQHDMQQGIGNTRLSVPDEAQSQRQRSSENIKVAVRVRSFLPREGDANQLCIRMKNHTCELTCDTKMKYPFTFDAAFWSNDNSDEEIAYSTQEDVFTELGPSIIEHVFNGLNASVICYGQTGSGKTYTMFGPPSPTSETFGLVPRICGGLFSRLNKDTQHFKATVSIVEIYMEKTFDLLNQRKELRIRGDLRNGFRFFDAHQIEITGYDSILPLLKDADLQKTYSCTALNERSSRAHTLFELNVRTFGAKGTRVSKLMLVDLAGSERVKASGAEGKSFEQACNINLSLMNLGKCIEGVASQVKTNNDLVEFRHSALTKLLKESLGGNAKTTILVTISPSQADAINTLHALRFADRAKKIRNHAIINEYSLERQLFESNEINREFEARMNNLKVEYELERKQQALLGRQIELEQQLSGLEEERHKLSQERKDYLCLTVKERDELTRREREVQGISSKLDSEFQDLYVKRKELEEKIEEVSKQNNLFLEDKKMAEKEIIDLQDEINDLQNAYSTEADKNTILTVRTSELEDRAEIESSFLSGMMNILDQQRKEQNRFSALISKTEIVSERRKHHTEALDLKKQLQYTKSQLASLQSSYDEKYRVSHERIIQLEMELSFMQMHHCNSLVESMQAVRDYCSQVCALKDDIRAIGMRLTKKDIEIYKTKAAAQSTQLLQEEFLERQNTLYDEQSDFFLLQICTKHLTELLRDENMTRGKVLLAEKEKYHVLREEYFSRQKQIFYQKALSLTKCIQADRY